MYIQLIPVTKTGSAGETGKRIMNFYWRNSHFLFDPPFLDFFFFLVKIYFYYTAMMVAISVAPIDTIFC